MSYYTNKLIRLLSFCYNLNPLPYDIGGGCFREDKGGGLVTFNQPPPLYVFTKHYNYRKQKHIPASVTGNLKYYLERDSKSRRVISNPGKVFRNSKWSNLSATNITSPQSPDKYYSFMTYLLVLTTFVLFLVSASPYDLILSLVTSTFLTTPDSELTYAEMFVLSLPYLIYYLLSACSHLFFLALFSPSLHRGEAMPISRGGIRVEGTTKDLGTEGVLIGDGDHLVVFDSKFVADYNPYKDSKLLATYFEVLESSTTHPRPVSSDFTSLILYKKYYLICTSLNRYNKCRSQRLSEQRSFDGDQYLDIIRVSGGGIKGTFYFTLVGYQTLNNLLNRGCWSSITCSLLKDASFVNYLRWVYTNSNLHRRVIFNSHKLTESKKLISSGYFDSSSTRTNLWFSDKYSRDWIIPKARKSSRIRTSRVLNILDLLGVQSRLLYKKPHNLSPNTLNPLSFYEPSFHHLLGRCQYYSSLWAMRYFTNPRPRCHTEGVSGLSPLLLYSTALNIPGPTYQGISSLDLLVWDSCIRYNYFLERDDRSLSRHQTPQYPTHVRNSLVINRPRKSLNSDKKGHIIVVTKPISPARASLYTPTVVLTLES